MTGLAKAVAWAFVAALSALGLYLYFTIYRRVYLVASEFRPDGTCRVLVDRESLFGPNDDPRTWLDDSGNIWCTPLGPNGVPTGYDDALLASLFRPGGRPLKPGRYGIDNYYPGFGQTHFVQCAVFDKRLNAKPHKLGHIFGRYSIKAIDGEFEIIELDSVHAVGRINFRGRESWSM